MNTSTQRQPLSDLQGKVLAYLVKFLQMNDQLPTCDNIAAAFGWASSNSAALHLQTLEKKGYLARNELGRIMLADRPATASPFIEAVLMLVGERAAGWDKAAPARDDVEASMQSAARNEARAIYHQIRELVSKEVAHG